MQQVIYVYTWRVRFRLKPRFHFSSSNKQGNVNESTKVITADFFFFLDKKHCLFNNHRNAACLTINY